jgi:hypothetical protein
MQRDEFLYKVGIINCRRSTDADFFEQCIDLCAVRARDYATRYRQNYLIG